MFWEAAFADDCGGRTISACKGGGQYSGTRLNLVSGHYGGVAKQKVSTDYSQPRVWVHLQTGMYCSYSFGGSLLDYLWKFLFSHFERQIFLHEEQEERWGR